VPSLLLRVEKILLAHQRKKTIAYRNSERSEISFGKAGGHGDVHMLIEAFFGRFAILLAQEFAQTFVRAVPS